MTRSAARPVPVPSPRPPGEAAATGRRIDAPRLLLVGVGSCLVAAVVVALAGQPAGAVACLAAAVAVLGWDRWAAGVRRRCQARLAEQSAGRARVVGEESGDSSGSAARVRERTAGALRPGMVVGLAGGDVVAAAATVVSARELLVDDYALAGDEAPVPRRASPGDLLLEGTMVLRGTGTARVEQAASGLVVEETRGARRARRQLAGLVAAVAAALGGLAAAAVVVGYVAGSGREGLVAAASVLVGVAVVVAGTRAVPTVAALAAGRLQRDGVTVRGPAVLDRVGAVDLLAVTSTVALTSERTSVVQTWVAGGETLSELARATALAGPGSDDATDHALAEWARSITEGDDGSAGPGEAADPAPPLVAEVPWDAGRRRVTTAHAEAGEILVVCKGAPDAIWPLLVTSSDGVSAGASGGQRVAETWLDRGWRVIGLATTRRTVAGNTAGRLEWGLRLVGLLALTSTPREGAADAVARLRSGGVDVAMMTADHEDTALAVASAVGVIPRPRGAPVATGDGIGGGMWADDVRVFGRTAPEQHRDVVARWQSAGHVVALAGSTMADGPALRRSDLGVCLGAADEVARSASSVHTADADLSLLVRAVAVARRTRHVSRRVLAVTTAAAGSLAIVALAGAAAGATWLWPGQAAVVGTAAILPAVVAASLGTGASSGLGQRSGPRVLDGWWWLWVVASTLGVAAAAVAAAGLAALAGAVVADVAPAVLAGALPVGGVLAVTSRSGGPPDRPSTTGRRRGLVTAAVATVVALLAVSSGVLHEGASAPWAAWVVGAVAGAAAVLVARLVDGDRAD